MKILIVNTSDIIGGAARSAHRLHMALLNKGVESQMLVQYKNSDNNTIIGPISRLQKLFAIARPYIDNIFLFFYKHRTNTLFSLSWLPFSGIAEKINEVNADVVHLHWVAGGMMSVSEIRKIKAPIVWSLHDNWAFTGGCHIKWDCERYKEKCGKCPRLKSSFEFDLSRWVYFRKANVYKELDRLTIVGLSRWITDCAINSSLFKEHQVVNIPNPIDTQIFKPFDKEQARKLWGLPSDKNIILFGANSATKDINKGFLKFLEALEKVKSNNIEIVVYGSGKASSVQDFGFNVHYLGHLHDDISLVTLYSASDVMVVPSLQENLSNAIMESLSCGTPVVAFDIGGNSDLIDHQMNGYLATPYSTDDLANGIDWVLEESDYLYLCNSARDKVTKCFDSKIIASKYTDLYESIIKIQ